MNRQKGQGIRTRRTKIKENLQMLTMTIPGLVLVLLFCYLPMPGIAIAFKKYNPNLGIWGSEWNGLDNFKFFFTSQDAGRTIRNTVLYSVGFLIIDLVFAVGLALMFYFLRSKKGLKVYNTIVITPKFMSAVIVAFIVYAILSPSYGLLNSIIKFFGGEPIAWYSEAKYWPWILTITHIWQTVGMNSIVYYASLMSLDESHLEAAVIDGANRRQQIFHVIIPHLVPIMVITTILGMGSIFGGDFGLFYQVPKDQGLLYSTTDIISTYTYRAMLSGSLEKSAAVGLFQSVVGLIMVVTTNAIVKKISPENSLF